MLNIGISGGIGSGKSIVCNIFKHLGVPVFNTDESAKQLMNSSSNIKNELISMFGDEVYSNGSLNIPFLRTILFANAKHREKINAVVHPVVWEEQARWLTTLTTTSSYALTESALLFDTGSYKVFDKTITVYSPMELRVSRLIDRDGIGYEEVLKKIQSQLADEERCRLANYIIRNDNMSSLIEQVQDLHRMLTNNN